MSLRKKTSARWLVPGIILLFVCAGLATLILRQRSSDSSPPASIPREVESQKALLVPGAKGPSFNPAGTNQPEAADDGDRVVVLSAEGNQFLAQGNYAEAV